RQHHGIALAVAVARTGDAVPALVADDRESVSRGRTEPQLLDGGVRAVSPRVEDGPEMRLSVVARKVELHGDRLAERIRMHADSISGQIAEQDGNGIEGEPVDAAPEASLQGATELPLEDLLQGPGPERARQLTPGRALRGRQEDEVLRVQVEFPSRTVPVGPH